MEKILLIEDDFQVCSFVKKGLEEEGYSVETQMNGEDGIEGFKKNKHDLILLDIMLPTIGGLEVCKIIRSESDVPILLLTALGTAENVALGLNTGADDYLVKPFKFIELVARVKSLLRRVNNNSKEERKIISFADIVIDDVSKIVKRNNTVISLTSTEFRLLKMFLENPRKVLSRVKMLEEVWGVNFDIGTNVVDVYVNYLRKKLDAVGGDKLIHTVIGMGYVLKKED